jgi:hypothetical protein
MNIGFYSLSFFVELESFTLVFELFVELDVTETDELEADELFFFNCY